MRPRPLLLLVCLASLCGLHMQPAAAISLQQQRVLKLHIIYPYLDFNFGVP